MFWLSPSRDSRECLQKPKNWQTFNSLAIQNSVGRFFFSQNKPLKLISFKMTLLSIKWSHWRETVTKCHLFCVYRSLYVLAKVPVKRRVKYLHHSQVISIFVNLNFPVCQVSNIFNHQHSCQACLFQSQKWQLSIWRIFNLQVTAFIFKILTQIFCLFQKYFFNYFTSCAFCFIFVTCF